jgi:hypothetical protein
VPLWRDVDDLVGGSRWRDETGRAIRVGSAFIAMFSTKSEIRDSSYMRDELVEAAEELRRQRDRPWFIPVRLDACNPPPLNLGAGERLLFRRAPNRPPAAIRRSRDAGSACGVSRLGRPDTCRASAWG